MLDSGLRVIDVLGWYEVGETPEAIAEDFGIPPAAVFEALAYANEYPQEIKAIRERNKTALRRLGSETSKRTDGGAVGSALSR